MIIGAGHIAIPLARMAAILDMRVVVVDDRPDYATRERFPDAEEIHIVRYDEEREELAPIEAVVDSNTFVVVATWGWDQPALAQVLTRNPAYVALVASPAKARAIFQGLRGQGLPEARLAEVRTPAGLDIGAETPAEIALSILAETLSVRRSRGGKPMMEARRQGPPPQE
ncbi:MAG: XdhC family protein [Thermodesulfobacteriota bacterium]